MGNHLSLKAAPLELVFVPDAEFDRVVDPKKMVQPDVASEAPTKGARLSVCDLAQIRFWRRGRLDVC